MASLIDLTQSEAAEVRMREMRWPPVIDRHAVDA
jgi:hypothetical protein